MAAYQQFPGPGIYINYVDFDIDNLEHIAAFVMLSKHGRQHPTLRFNLYQPYTNVLIMMYVEITSAYVAQMNLSDDLAYNGFVKPVTQQLHP